MTLEPARQVEEAMKLAALCTIVIPVHNRQQLLPRLLNYLTDYPGEVLITDSSQSPLPPSTLSIRQVRYVHVPGQLYYEKMLAAYSAVSTPYVVDVPDDDFIVKESIVAAIAAMNADSACVCVFGRPIRISSRYGTVDADTYWPPHVQNMAFNRPQLSILRRLAAAMYYFEAANHMVFRRDVLVSAFKLIVLNKALWPVRFVDKILLYVTVCSGTIRYIERPMCLRDETRLITNPDALPPELEASVSAAALPERLKAIDPLAPLLARALGRENSNDLIEFNQKLFGKLLAHGTRYKLRGWESRRYPGKLSQVAQREIREVMTVVNAHRSFGQKLIGVAYPIVRTRLFAGRILRLMAERFALSLHIRGRK